MGERRIRYRGHHKVPDPHRREPPLGEYLHALILDMVTRYLREARKYFAGIVLASQSVRDYMPEGDFSGADNIRILFELCQYKFMFKQDSSAKEHIRRIFGEGMTFSQVESIPFWSRAKMFSPLRSRSAAIRVWLSRDYEATLFSGGR